jgi:hypothetical protein
MTPGRPALTSATGSAAIELAIGIFGWMAALLLVAAVYQLQAGSADVAHAAAEAARAASMTSGPADAERVATSTAEARLVQGPCEPNSVVVDVDTARFRAGGSVVVAVTCHIDALLGSSRTVTATGDEAIDRYRGGL